MKMNILQTNTIKILELSSDISITNQYEDELYKITNSQGDFLFSLDLSNSPRKNQKNITIALVCFLIAIISLFTFLFWYVYSRKSGKGSTISLILSISILGFVFFSLFHFKFPGIIFLSGLFQPDLFANLTFSSLGNLWAFVLFVLLMVFLFYKFFDRSKQIPEKLHQPLSFLLLLLASFWFILLHRILSVLVLDSNISFEAFKLNSLDLYTFVGLFILAMGFIALCLLIHKALTYHQYQSRIRQIVAVLISVCLFRCPFYSLMNCLSSPDLLYFTSVLLPL